jgi:tetratricopeptide (TPR) repeat protein
MARKPRGKAQSRKAQDYEEHGLLAYKEWNIDDAIKHFEAASRLLPEEPDYLLQLARALARGGDFDRALKALAEFIRLEPESPLAERFQQLFASGMDDVESILTDKMTDAGTPIELIGAAIQMWLEYRIALGRETLIMRKPETWAAALDYTIQKINLRPVKRQDIATFYGISDSAVRDRHADIVGTLDVMPCDYRYFVGKENPLDKLVEAAELLEQLETRFQEP